MTLRVDFVVFSDDWGAHPSSCQHLFRCIAKTNRVLWVNTVGMRTPRFSIDDVRKATRKLSAMLRGGGAAANEARPDGGGANLRVIQPLMLPLPGSRLARRFNGWSARRAVRRAMQDLAFERPVVLTTVPNACDVVGRLGGRAVVYYCVDDFSQWPGLHSEAVRKMERRLIRRADVLLATSDRLREALASSGKRVAMLAHGIDLPHFAKARRSEVHPALRDFPRPLAVFFGLIDERLDEELIVGVAKRLPGWTFAFVGPKSVPAPLLSRLSNVRFVPPVPYAEIPYVASSADVLIVPYVVSAFTETISPLKLNEYLASGRPVVSSPLPEARRRHAFVAVANSIDDWCTELRSSLSAAQTLSERAIGVDSELAGDSWEARAGTLLTLCAEAAGSDAPRARNHGDA